MRTAATFLVQSLVMFEAMDPAEHCHHVRGQWAE